MDPNLNGILPDDRDAIFLGFSGTKSLKERLIHVPQQKTKPFPSKVSWEFDGFFICRYLIFILDKGPPLFLWYFYWLFFHPTLKNNSVMGLGLLVGLLRARGCWGAWRGGIAECYWPASVSYLNTWGPSSTQHDWLHSWSGLFPGQVSVITGVIPWVICSLVFGFPLQLAVCTPNSGCLPLW